MLLHLDRSDLRQFQIALGQEDVLIDADGRIAVLSVSFGLESWKSFFQLIEEVLECLLQMAERLLQRNAVHFLQEGVLFCFLQYGQLFGTGSIAQGSLVFFVLADLSIKPAIVDKADTAECLCKEDLLCRRWIESEFVGFIWHFVSSSLSLISLYCIFISISTEKLSFSIHLSPIEVGVFLPIVDKTIVPGRTLIILEEIQECPDARTMIKALVEDNTCEYIETGSLLEVRFKEIRSCPVGFEQIEFMYPQDLEEFLSFLSKKTSTSKVEDVT